MKGYSSYLLAGVLALSLTGLAKSKKNAPEKEATQTADTFDQGWMNPKFIFDNEDEYKKQLADIKKRPRKAASEFASTDVPAIENTFKADYVKLRNELVGSRIKGDENEFGVTSPERLAQLVDHYSKPSEYAKLSPQAKFLAIQLRSLKPFQGVIFRAKSYISKYSAIRTMIVSGLRTQIAGIDAFFTPGPEGSVNHWEVVFRYLTEYTPGTGSEILNDKDLHNYFRQVASLSYPIVYDLGVLANSGEKFWWDNRVYMSYGNFASEKDHYVAIGTAELKALYSVGMFNMSALSSSTAYSFDGLQEVAKDLGELYGVYDLASAAKAAASGAPGMSSMSRIRVLKKYESLFELNRQYGKSQMENAYKYLVESVKAAKLAFNEAKKGDRDRDANSTLTMNNGNLFNPNIAIGMDRIANASFENMDLILDERGSVNNEVEIKSAIFNGDVIKVTLKNFYMNPPQNMRELYPTKWDESWLEKEVDAPGYKHRKLRNYRHGKAIEWPLASYQKIFPKLTGYEAQGKDRKDGPVMRTTEIPRYVRVLSQTWGSSVFAIPLGAAIF